MPIQSTVVHGPLYSPGLVALEDAKIIFDLTSWDANPNDDVFVAGPYVADVDAQGNFEVTLFTNTNGINQTVYEIYVSYIDQNSKHRLYDPRIKKFLGTVSLTGSGPFCIADLNITSEYSPGSFDLYATMLGLVSSAETNAANAEEAANRVDLGALDTAVEQSQQAEQNSKSYKDSAKTYSETSKNYSEQSLNSQKLANASASQAATDKNTVTSLASQVETDKDIVVATKTEVIAAKTDAEIARDASSNLIREAALVNNLEADWQQRIVALEDNVVDAGVTNETYYKRAEMRFRPGDVPGVFDLGEATVQVTPHGTAAVTSTATIVKPLELVAIEEGSSLELKVGYYRTVESLDPANDAVQVRIRYFDQSKTWIGAEQIVNDSSLTVADGYKTVIKIISWNASIADKIIPPTGAKYATVEVEFFGVDHSTAVDLLMLRTVPQWSKETVKVRAEGVYTSEPEFEWPSEWIPGEPVARTIFVSEGGDDSNNGRSLRNAVRSIEQARDIAAADDTTLWSIQVWPGTYQTQGHIDFPDNCTGVISATAARSTKIIPAPGYEERNVFRMGNGGYVQGFSFEGGWRVDDLDNPTEGFAISFRPGAVINRTVYAHNIVMYRTGNPVLIPPPLDRANQNPMVGRGGGVILADRDVVSPYSVFPQIMAWGATPSNPNGIGYCAKNGAFINAINAIALWSHKQYMALNGGLIIASGCASQAGDWSLWSEGYRNQVESYDANTAAISAYPTAASAIESNETAIQDAMWSHLVAEGYTNGLSTESAASLEAHTRKDATFLLLSLRYDLEAGQQNSVKLFTQGMFNWNAVPVWSSGDLSWFTMAWEKIRDEINALVSAGAQAMVTTLIDDVLIGTTNASTIPTKRIPSVVSAQNHQWNQTLSGVNGRAFSRPSQEVPQSIVEKNLGRVVYSGVDENGKQYFTGGALVNPLTGQLEGPPIDRTILPRARRAAMITGGQT